VAFQCRLSFVLLYFNSIGTTICRKERDIRGCLNGKSALDFLPQKSPSSPLYHFAASH
jgi:hypothetical protein